MVKGWILSSPRIGFPEIVGAVFRVQAQANLEIETDGTYTHYHGPPHILQRTEALVGPLITKPYSKGFMFGGRSCVGFCLAPG